MKTISFYGVEAQDMLLQHTAFWYIEYFKLKEFEEGHCDTPPTHTHPLPESGHKTLM